MQYVMDHAMLFSLGLGLAHAVLSVALHGFELDENTILFTIIGVLWLAASLAPGLNMLLVIVAAVLLVLRVVGLLHNRLKRKSFAF